jgi:RNA recognition motif-containing protein
MASKLFVGNLSYSTTDDRVREVFAQYGEVLSATVVRDRATGQSRGFGFVEFGSDEHAQSAMQALNGADLDGRSITVNVARERERGGPPRGGFGGGGGGYGGGGGGYGGGGGGYGGGGGGRGGGGGGGRDGGGGGGRGGRDGGGRGRDRDRDRDRW